MIDFNKCICKDINIYAFCRMHWNGDDSSNLMFKLPNLKDRSLIKWAENGSFYMHEQLQNMGRNITVEVKMN